MMRCGYEGHHLGDARASPHASPKGFPVHRGTALRADLSDAGRAVLPSTVPDSGTPFRALGLWGALGGAGNAAGYVSPGMLATGAGLLGAYTRPGARIATGLLAGRRPAGAGLLGDALARGGGPIAVPLGALTLEPPEPAS